MEHDNAHHDPPGKEGARRAGRDDCGPPEHPDLSWGRRSGVHPCQDPPGPAAHPRTDGPPGRRPRPPTARYPGGADQAVRHLAGVLGARRRSGHPHHKTQAPGHRGPYTPHVIGSLHAGACEAAHAGGADPGGHASPQEPRQNRPPPAAAHTQPASWRDRNRAEPDPMRAASRPEGMTATAPESAGRQIFSSYLIWPLTTSV